MAEPEGGDRAREIKNSSKKLYLLYLNFPFSSQDAVAEGYGGAVLSNERPRDLTTGKLSRELVFSDSRCYDVQNRRQGGQRWGLQAFRSSQ
jgi:hypothetical protein